MGNATRRRVCRTVSPQRGPRPSHFNRAEQAMHRRDFLKTATAGSLATVGGLAVPRLARAAGSQGGNPGDSKVLRFVPQANLANLDPIWTTQYVVRNGSLLI